MRYIFLVLVLIVMVGGCGDPENPMFPAMHTLEINGLDLTHQSIETGNTATVTALIDYSGTEEDLFYTWSATGGTIVGHTASVTYLASDIAGAYTIALEVTDGTVVNRQAIDVEVIDIELLQVESGQHWANDGFKQKLAYQVNVEAIIRPDVKLQYEILQDRAAAGAFLSIEVNNTVFAKDVAIGSVQPTNHLITDGINVSSVINAPGQYEIVLTLVVVKVVERGWQLQNTVLVGVKGSAVRI